MSDFMTVMYQMCKSIDGPTTAKAGGHVQYGLFSERSWPVCSCKAYQFARHGYTNFGGVMKPNRCKHIIQAEKEVCGWHGFDSMIDAQDEEQKVNMICPSCEGETIWVKVAV